MNTPRNSQHPPQKDSIIDKIKFFEKPYPRIPNKTVYILGAGFSAPLGFPVMGSFVSQGLRAIKASAWQKFAQKESDTGAKPVSETEKADEALRKQSQDKCARLLPDVQDLIDRYLPFFASYEKEEPSLEDLFCAVDLFSGREKNGEWINPDRPVLCEFIREVFRLAWAEHCRKLDHVRNHSDSHPLVPTVAQAYFRTEARAQCSGLKPSPSESLPANKSEACMYRAFLSQLYSNETIADVDLKREGPDYANSAIISLNYDPVLENKIADFGGKLKYFYGRGVVGRADSAIRDLVTDPKSCVEHEKLIPLIKLHGSLDWRFSQNGDAPHRKHVDVVPDCTAAGACGVGGDEASCEQCLIYPTWQRDPLGNTVFDTLFCEARIHLRLASRIVIIGYSLPETDRYINYLFSDIMRTPEIPRIEICNRGDSDEWRRRARKLFGGRLSMANLTITNGLEEHIRSNPDPDAPNIF